MIRWNIVGGYLRDAVGRSPDGMELTSATPRRMMTKPRTRCGEIGSRRNSQPHRIPKTGIRKVTLRVFTGPTRRMRWKYKRYARAVDRIASPATEEITAALGD